MSTQYVTTYSKKKNPWEELGAILGEGVKKAQTEVPKEKKRKEEEEDEFLAGFRQYENEEKEQLEKFAKIRANADKRAGVADKVLEEDEKQKDQFLAGFNEYADLPKSEQTDAKHKQKALATAEEAVKLGVYTGQRLLDPLKDTPYEYRDRNLIRANYNLPVRATQKGWQRMDEPLGSFSIAKKGTPSVVDMSGKPVTNQLLSLETKYIDADGVLQESTIPQWVISRELIKRNNAQAIDKFTKMLRQSYLRNRLQCLLTRQKS